MKRTGKEAKIDVRCPGKEARLITSIATGSCLDGCRFYDYTPNEARYILTGSWASFESAAADRNERK